MTEKPLSTAGSHSTLKESQRLASALSWVGASGLPALTSLSASETCSWVGGRHPTRCTSTS
eukprot:7383351-Prymnesium_polylepis.1